MLQRRLPSISASSRAFMMMRRYLRSDEAAQLGVGGGRIEAQQRLVLLDQITFLDQHLAEDAAFEMLHLLVLAGGDERARDDDGALERCDGGPDAEPADAEQQDRRRRSVSAAAGRPGRC